MGNGFCSPPPFSRGFLCLLLALLKRCGSAVDRFFALLGADDDELKLFGNLLRIEGDLDGGPGNADRLIDLGNDVRGTLRTRNFELFG